MRTPFDSGLLEVRDAIDRRVSYVAVWSEDEETLGLIAWIGRRMVCLCQLGRGVYEDRLDGSLTWADAGCEHEVHYLAVKKQREAPAVGISGGREYDVSSAMWD